MIYVHVGRYGSGLPKCCVWCGSSVCLLTSTLCAVHTLFAAAAVCAAGVHAVVRKTRTSCIVVRRYIGGERNIEESRSMGYYMTLQIRYL